MLCKMHGTMISTVKQYERVLKGVKLAGEIGIHYKAQVSRPQPFFSPQGALSRWWKNQCTKTNQNQILELHSISFVKYYSDTDIAETLQYVNEHSTEYFIILLRVT